MKRLLSAIARRPLIALPLGMLAVVGLALAARPLLITPAALYAPLPVYEIEATSGSHHASLLNLPVGQPGVPQAPVPVDVDGDLLPDVLVSLNLEDSRHILVNPPEPAEIIAPNIEIDRAETAVLLNKPSPPLRIAVKLTATDVEGDQPDLELSFGYDTGAGGSIPTHWKATVGGLEDGFNPLEAAVDTGPTFRERPATYEGPLSLVGSIHHGDRHTDLGFAYDPFPGAVHVTYADDAAGQHIDYAHDSWGEVDLLTDVHLEGDGDTTDLRARVDRLPRAINLDLASDAQAGTGKVHYAANADGRLPDIGVTIDTTSDDEDSRPLHADVDIEALPAEIHAEWAMPEDGPASAVFDAGGAGVGAVEADVRTFDGTVAGLEPFVATEQQYLSLRQVGPANRISGRVERIRHLEFSQSPGGFETDLSVGDGELPIEVDYSCTGGCDDEDRMEAITARATVSPLPDHFTAAMSGPADEDSTIPLVLSYTASQTTGVAGHVELRRTGAGTGAACGAQLTLCADVDVHHLPVSLTATIAETAGATEKQTRIAVDQEPREGGARPDLFATATIGSEEAGDRPVVLEADLLHLPPTTRALMHQTITEVEGEPEPVVTLDRAEFHACDWQFDAAPPACAAGTDDPIGIGALRFAARNFLVRPADLPLPAPDTPLYAALTSRGDAFEAVGRITRIREVQYLNDNGLIGVRTRAGGGDPFAARFDIEDAQLGDDYKLSDDLVLDGATLDLLGEARLGALPTQFDVCFRKQDRPLGASLAPFTAPCEGDPFATDRAPMSAAYRANQPTSVDGQVEATVAGSDQATDDDYEETARTEVGLDSLPPEITVHMETPPEETEGPMRIEYLASEQVTMRFAGEKRVGDSECLDPRVTARAVCARALLENLPTHATLRYDPTEAADNLEVTADGALPTNLKELLLTSVKPAEDGPGADVLVLSGQLLGLPAQVNGTLRLPVDEDDATTVDLSAAPGRIDQVDLDVSNFVSPDPTPTGPPAPRDGVPAASDTVEFYQRGQAFRAAIHVSDLAGGGYRTGRDADDNKLDTQAVAVDFGMAENEPPPTIRAFADLDTGEARTIADVTLSDVPAGLELCLRGQKLTDGTPVDPTFCDIEPEDNEGAVQLAGTPGNDPTGLDVDGYLRQSTGGDADILAAAFHVDDVPFTLDGVFPAGDSEDAETGKGGLDIAGFEADGTTPKGFTAIDFEIASFDLADSGYDPAVEKTLFVARGAPPEPFEAPAPADPTRQHLALVSSGAEFHARGRIEGLDHLFVDDEACAEPDAGRDDYPEFPGGTDDLPVSYTCAGAEFDGGSVDPLDLSAVLDDGDERMSLTQAGLTNIPDWFQVTISDTEPLDTTLQHKLRPRCGTPADDNPQDCIPPMVRFDSSGDSELFGKLQLGTLDDIDTVETLSPQVPLPGIDDVPAAGDPGARVKVATFDELGGDSRAAVQVGVRVAVPGSLTVHHPQSWTNGGDDDDLHSATDLRFGYIARDANGDVIPELGHLKAVIHSYPADPEDADTEVVVSDDLLGPGVVIPGELDLGLYLRDDAVIPTTRTLVQAEGRVSAPMTIGATIFTGTDPGVINVRVANLPAPDANIADDEPSFRVQAEIISLNVDNEPPDPCTFLLCAESKVKLQSVNAFMDFEPEAGNPAHLVQAVVQTDGLENNVHVASFDRVSGVDPDDDSHRAPVSMGAFLSVDPLNFSFHAGIPVLGAADFTLESDLRAGFTLEKATDFKLANNLMAIQATQEGPANSTSTIGPVDLTIDTLSGEAWALFVKVFGIDFIDTNPGEPLDLDFIDCDAVGLTPLGEIPANLPESFPGIPLNAFDNATEVGPGNELNVVVWPLNDNRIRIHDLTFGASEFLEPVIQSFLCLGLDPEITELIGADHPGDPLNMAGHPVPDLPFTDPADPQPDPVDPPDDLVDATLTGGAMCGVHQYKHLTIDGLVTVSADPAVCPDQRGKGTLTINADKVTITANGSIDAKAIVNGDASFYQDPYNPYFQIDAETMGKYKAHNGGAGHTDYGGYGNPVPQNAFETRGRYYASQDDTDPVTEPGFRGGSGTNALYGYGGGVVILNAELIELSGSIDVSGGDGQPADVVDCNTQFRGNGAGSGGGIVLNAPKMTSTSTAQLIAHGGKGGDGWGGGGGGAGGTIKLLSVVDHFDPAMLIDYAGGPGGASPQGCEFNSGTPGGSGDLVEVVHRADSRARGLPSKFWHNAEGGLDVPYAAAVTQTIGLLSSDSFQVAACGVRHQPDGSGNLPENWLFNVAGPASVLHPCGFPNGTFQFIGWADHPDEPDEQVLFTEDQTIHTVALPSGYWGIWTRVIKPDTEDNNCFDHGDFLAQPNVNDPPGLNYGLIYDQGDCLVVEPMPPEPDTVIGVDNVDPEITTFTADADANDPDNFLDVTRRRAVTVTLTGTDQIGPALLSGIEETHCWEELEDGTELPFTCPLDTPFTVSLSDSDGVKHLRAYVVDRAGNQDFAVDIFITLDRQAPTATATLSPPTGDLENGWYSASPQIQFNGYDDGAGVGPPNTGEDIPTYLYTFDDGSEESCFADFPEYVCDIPTGELPNDGRHLLRFTALDRAGNRRFHDTGLLASKRPQMHVVPIEIDSLPPLVAGRAVPGDPNGENGWYRTRPFVGITAVDQPVDGSGVDPTQPPSAIFHTVTSNGQSEPEAVFTEPLRLGQGTHEVCFRAVDVAGHSNPGGVDCVTGIKVDTQAPQVFLSSTPASPTGQQGWFVGSPPTVSVSTIDGLLTPGSGVDASQPGSGVFVSVDGRAYIPYTGPLAMSEGLHEVRAFAVDVAGNRSDVKALVIKVDQSHPVSTARVRPPEAAGAGWWRSLPTVVLRATDGDQNAGTARLEYSLDNGPWTTYAGPFDIPAGTHQVRYRAVDRSGPANAETARTLTIPVDVTAPVAKALAPQPLIWSKKLSGVLTPSTAKLNWQISDTQSSTLKVTVLIYDELGRVIARLDGGSQTVTPGATKSGFTAWNGKSNNEWVPIGFYHYRVVVSDAAGNTAQSGESKPVQVKFL